MRVSIAAPRRRSWLILLGILLLVSGARIASSQIRPRTHGGAPAARRITAPELNAGLRDVDRMLEEGFIPGAAAALKRLAEDGADPAHLRLRWITLHDARGDYPAMIKACRQGLAERHDNPRLRRDLIAALASADSLKAARREVELLLGVGTLNLASAAGVIDLWRERGHPEEGLALCERIREERGDPRLFARNRAQCLAVLERYPDAAAEFLKVLEINPLDIAPVRRDLREYIAGTEAHEAYLDGLYRHLDPDNCAAALLAIDAALYLGRTVEAIGIYSQYSWSDRDLLRLLRLTSILGAELGMYQDQSRALATGHLLLRVLGPRGIIDDLPPAQTQSAMATLAEVCATLLSGIVPTPQRDASESDAFLSEIREALLLVRQENPASEAFFLAQIRLADYQRDARGDPAAAVADLQRLLQDLNLPVAGLSAATLSLGKSHLAAADTAAARGVFERLSADERFPGVGLMADYLLGLLDIAQGHWDAGQERLTALAEKDPGSSVANDALDEGLRIAEMKLEPDLDESLWDGYAHALLWELLDRPRQRASSLAALVAIAEAAGSPSSVSIAEYARMELALLALNDGRPAAAASQCDTLAARYPGGRYPARAMLLKIELQLADGDTQGADLTRDLLLIQYPDSPQAETARLSLEKE